MKKLIVLSDLWGRRKSDWYVHYQSLLDSHFEIVYYDCCELANIDLSDFSEEKIHQQFTNGGVDRAVKALLDIEKDEVFVLGFSVGGLIAWKAALEGLMVNNLFAVSSTRLRYEVDQPSCDISLFYGEHDKFKPTPEWFAQQKLDMNIYPNQEHFFYSLPEIADDICKKMLKKSN